ncbi:hypothetical protein M408DRAFT_19240 [Serendipita vermifera MAFF 305830]|uniref:Protein ZIP4 homolog n=1 Tax=Serendipita vermifera MAFF 305830 TaxID=933852 RepID=A0A0C2X8C3_SERVB|nr:hypothetical protein M408DRAFT_19240 [Serendipita vermifera MAFF 305830]
MSPKRRKPNDEFKDIHSVYAKIIELLLVVQPSLAQAANKNTNEVVRTLHEIAKLAETFTTLRVSEHDDSVAALLDRLDTEGVGLWNSATYLKSSNGPPTSTFAAARYAGFRLIEAGLNDNPSEKVLVDVLELSSKVGMAFIDTDAAMADKVLTDAAKYQLALSRIPAEQTERAQARARAVVLYWTARMEAEWKQGNLDMALHMMRQIEDKQIEMMDPQNVEPVVGRIVDTAKSIAKGRNSDKDERDVVDRALKALEWMTRAFSIVDRHQKTSKLSSSLRRMILRNMARSYYTSSIRVLENLDKAEEALNELARVLNEAEDTAKGEEYQQLRWMSLAIYKKRNNTSAEKYLSVWLPLIDNATLTEDLVQDILLELRALSKSQYVALLHCRGMKPMLSHSFVVVTRALEHLISRALQENEFHQFVDNVLVSLILHVKASPSHEDAMTSLTKALDLISTSEDYRLERIPSTACLTIIWQIGDNCYTQKQWRDAADWFTLGTNAAFEAVADIAQSKCRRKAALCHIQNKDYAKAGVLIGQCSVNEAASCYLGFVVAAHQAAHHVDMMMKANDFDRRMLLMATNFARETQNHPLLQPVLAGLLDTLKEDKEVDIHAQGLLVIRCLARLVLQMTEEPGANLKKLIPMALQHFRTGNALVLDAIQKKKGAIVMRDLSWLWRVAYNSAVNGLNVWEDGDVTEMFLIARDVGGPPRLIPSPYGSQLMAASFKASDLKPEPDLYEHWIMASFAAISGQAFKARSQQDEEDNQQKARLYNIAIDIDNLFELARDMRSKENNDQAMAHIVTVLHLSLVYQVEILSSIQEWDHLSRSIEAVRAMIPISTSTYEAIADILWSEKSCPVTVLFDCLEAILRATTQQGMLSIRKFSKWLRAICSILLSRGQFEDRSKALVYMNQAIDVLKIHGSNATGDLDTEYPEDERHWLISTAFNTGVQVTSGLQIAEARQWFEVATILCQFIRDSPRERIEETYHGLLSQYNDAG